MIDLQHQILTHKQTQQKIRRIAYQVYENNFEEEEIIFAGIYENGYRLARLLRDEFSRIAPVPTQLISIRLDKANPMQSEVQLDCDEEAIRNKTVIVVDDVLNTGRTMAYSLKVFFGTQIKKLQTAVLVDRDHKLFPVCADYVGYALSTTINQHVDVVIADEDKFGVYLF